MSDLEPIQWSINIQKLKQTRVYVSCVCILPTEVRNTMAATDVIKAQGTFLLGFSAFPSVGETFPFQGQFWKVKAIVQFPHRYKTRGNKYPAIATLEWVGSYESIEEIITGYLSLKGNYCPLMNCYQKHPQRLTSPSERHSRKSRFIG
jgi:hypothetical protein